MKNNGDVIKSIDSAFEDRFSKSRTKFQNLMRHRVDEILLVSSQYDAFILASDGQLSELLISEFVGLNLYHAPVVTHVSDAKKALEMVRGNHRFDLIITTMRIGEMHVLNFAQKLRKMGVKIPIILLTYENRELNALQETGEAEVFDKLFLWQGDFRILLGIVKFVEDRLNVEHDTKEMGVQVIILVEDNIRFYSSYLPIVYTEIMRHSQSLIAEGLNLAHKILRMRARPKIMLCETFEEAWGYFKKYEKHILGVISDIEFPLDGEKNPEAGIILASRIIKSHFDIPVLLQSFQPEISDVAQKLGIGFTRKDSRTLMNDVRQFLVNHLGFGNFIFRMPDGTIIDKAKDLKSFEEKLSRIPEECLLFHAQRNHFSTWLKARTEFDLAARLRPLRVEEWTSLAEMRSEVIQHLREARFEKKRELISEFQRFSFDSSNSFAHLGNGSLGGKARGLAFISHIINYYDVREMFDDVEIAIPPTVVLCTDVFEKFMELNDLTDFALQTDDDSKILRAFLDADFPEQYLDYLRDLIDLMSYPLAIRSSSLLEDSQYQPFAGVYATFMRANNDPDPQVRLDELLIAIKRIYASVYFHESKMYMEATPYRLEEEKMAVIIQKLVGMPHENKFYPDISGVARSYNFYSKPPTKASDGVANAALGLGQIVVEGSETIRFCPKFPKHLTQFPTIREFLSHTQKYFYALDLESAVDLSNPQNEVDLTSYPLDEAEKDGTLSWVGSVFSNENNVIYDGLSRNGVRLVTFAPILKHEMFPLPKILQQLLILGYKGMGGPVEIEYAANLSMPKESPKQFAVLQIRPMVLSREIENLEIEQYDLEDVICCTDQVLGVGVIDNIYDIIYVDINRYDRSKSTQVVQEIEEFNTKLLRQARPYILIGVGRWGSADPWLGIPVKWDQICGARVIVEAGFRDMKVTPSQGAHFFHNLTSFMVGYFTISHDSSKSSVQWDWLSRQKIKSKTEFVRHIRLKNPAIVKMNGYKHQGVIYKPEL